MAIRTRTTIKTTSDIFNIISGCLAIVTFLLTGTSFLVSVQHPPTFVVNFQSLQEYLQGSEDLTRYILFIISELANACFFGLVFNWLHRRYRNKLFDAFLFAVVIFLTAYVSLLFLKMITFYGEISGWAFVGFSFSYLLSFGITTVIFFIENCGDHVHLDDAFEKLVARIGTVTFQWSFYFLAFAYALIYLLALKAYLSGTFEARNPCFPLT